jgi:hypothetical protein
MTECQFYPLTDLSSGTLEVDFSADRSWTWSDFNGANIAVQLIATKQGNQTATLDVDAVAFRVSNGVICNDPNDIISPLPVSDTFDNTLLQFVSADPPESSVVGGTITWDDVGPLYPGATLRITVTFVALEPPDDDEPADGEADPTTHENCGTSTGATFIDGEPVNDAQDCETHDINPAGTIGDLVWSDVNSNGVYEPNGTDGDPNTADNEWGIPNVTVNLYDCGLDGVCDGGGGDDVFVATTTTDDTGWYLFESLRDGTYESVVVTTSLPDGGAGAVNTYDWDGDLDSDSGPVTINNNNGSSADDDFLDADFGYSLPALIIGSIWHDRDRSGSSTPDSGEEGLAGIVVYADDGACIPPTLPVPSGTCPYGITDANGDFVIGSADGPDGLPGTGDERLLTPDPTGTNYAVTVLQPSMPPGSWTQSYDTPNGPDGVPGTGDDVIQLDSLVQVTVVPGGLGRADYSYYQTGVTSLGDTLYVDWDGDGVEDPGEEGIPNVTVLLYEDDDGDGTIDPGVDAFMLTISTDATGFYHFDGLPADDYIVVVDEGDPDLPGNYNQTGDPDEDGVTCLVCDARGGADTVALDPDDTVDFGYQPVGAGSIGDFVWRDDDGDGIQDAGEPGIPDIDVDLYVWNDTNGDDVVDPGEQGPFVATASTGAGGEYLFTGLPAGKFLVNVDTTDPDLPVDGNSQPYVLSTNNDPHGVDLDVGEEYLDADFGFTAGGTIGDFVWQDNDTDGSQDLSEPGIPGVTVQLYNDVNGNGVYDPGTDTWVADDVTDGSGLYEFTGLPAGDYVVVVDTGTLPADFVQTGDPDETGACTTCDSESGTSIGDGDWIDWSRDFGYRPPGSIGDTVWIDTNGDGIKDDSETGIPYITVWLYDSDDVLVATTETDSGGIYGFGNVGDGSYYVRVDTSDSDFPSGLTLTYDPDEANPCTVCDSIGWTTISGGSSDLTRDFGYQFSGLNSISGTVYHDDDDDAIQDPVETTTYEDVTIYLWDCGADDSCGTGDDVFIGSTTTDANGDYIFSSLPDGLYVVAVNPDAPNLTGTDPTVTLSPTTSREVPLDHPLGTDPDPVNATDQDFGFLSRIDMGDLPASYGITSLSDDGARHIVPLEGAIYLGSAPPDTERNGQESANVDGDDNDGNDDEDGVAATPSVTWSAGPNGGSLDVTVGGCSGTCYFSAWIDWGNDDSLSQDGDRVLTAYPVSNGTQTIAFDIPAGATLDVEYYARYRLFASNSWLATSPTGMATNGEVEDYIHDLGPTAVSLVSLTATPAGSAILVEWETATEIDNLGFNLYRASSEDGPRVQLNGSLIPSQAPGSQAGAAYAYLDETSAPGINYYWLEAMDTRGVTTLHGPVSAVVHSSNLYHIYFPRIGK